MLRHEVRSAQSAVYGVPRGLNGVLSRLIGVTWCVEAGICCWLPQTCPEPLGKAKLYKWKLRCVPIVFSLSKSVISLLEQK